MWNSRRALRSITDSQEVGLILQDDVRIIPAVCSKHLPDLASQCKGDVGMISLFTPPRKEFAQVRGKGYHGIKSNDFMWAQMIMVDPVFANSVIEYDTLPRPNNVEARYRIASQMTQRKIITLCKSLVKHDLSVKSTLGTASKIGSTVRDSDVMATVEDDYSNLSLLEKRHSTKDLYRIGL